MVHQHERKFRNQLEAILKTVQRERKCVKDLKGRCERALKDLLQGSFNRKWVGGSNESSISQNTGTKHE